MNPDELRKLDYEKTLQYANQLAEIRFKLLALIPVATGGALGLAQLQTNPISSLFLGVLGFFVTLGLVFYDQRNSEIYEKQMHRARLLELDLDFPSILGDDSTGGPVGGRPSRGRRLFGKFEMWHDRGLAFIYSVVLAVWSYLIAASVVELASPESKSTSLIVSLLVPVVIAVVCWRELHRLDKPSGDVVQLKKRIKEKQESR